MKKVLVPVGLLALTGAFVLAPAVVLGDQAFQTVRAPFSSLNETAYPLEDGFVISTHMNGPVNFEKKEFQLHGAKPDTDFYLYRVFAEAVGPFPAGTPLYAGSWFRTDANGNAHIMTTMAPDSPNSILLKSLGIEHLTATNVLYDGRLVKDGGTGGTPAYAADPYVTYFDWTWTP